MTLIRERMFSSKIVEMPTRWFRRKWNEAVYGLAQGKPAKDRMELLLGSEKIALEDFLELAQFVKETTNSRDTLRLAIKMRESVHQLFERRTL